MRLFIAVDISEQIRTALAKLQEQLQSRVQLGGTDVKWVRPELVHLTLKFLGQVSDGEVTEVCRAVTAVAAKYSCFDLEAGEVGYFGKGAANVLWVGIGHSEALSCLQKDIEQALAQAGWPAEARPFAEHLTLCRVRNPAAGRRLAAVCREFSEVRMGCWTVDSVCVYQSELKPVGPVYTVVSRTALNR